MLYVGAQIQSEMGAATVARYAAGRIFRLEDDSLLIDPLGEAGAKGPPAGGAIEFSRVKFAYPRRPHAQVKKENKIAVKNPLFTFSLTHLSFLIWKLAHRWVMGLSGSKGLNLFCSR